jgi:DNA replication protein DnaC
MLEYPVRYLDAVVPKEPTDRWNKAAHDNCLDFFKDWKKYLKEGKAPAFLGTAGQGKTYAACAVASTLAQQVEGFEFYFAPVGDTFDKLTASRDFRRSEFWEVDYKLKNAPLIIFDDFGHLSEYPRHRELFWIYVNARYCNMKSTIFTANLEDWEAVRKVFGEHITRRIQEMSEGLAVTL